MTLYFLYMDGCPACEAAKPELEKFARANPRIAVKKFDLLKTKWTYTAWNPEATPTYVLEELGYPRVQHVGALTKPRIEEFVASAKRMTGMP
jgi:hypothetical protein